MTKQEVLSLLQQASPDYISGEALSAQLKLSRTAIWKAVKTLRTEGYHIDALTNKGYRLVDAQADILSAYEITRRLQTQVVGKSVEVLETVESTNIYAKTRMNQVGLHGHVVIANAQTKGKSKQREFFYSPENCGLYCSLILQPEVFLLEQLADLRKATFLAIQKAVEQCTGLTISLRAASELVCGDKKIGGVLTEASIESESARIDAIVIGIGIYVNSTQFPPELQEDRTSLKLLTNKQVSRLELLCCLLNYLEKELENFIA